MKRFFAWLVVAVCAVVFVGCGNGGEDVADVISQNETQNEMQTEVQDEVQAQTQDNNGSDIPTNVSVGDIIQFGEYDWRVLDVQDGRALLLSDKVLELRRYHDTLEDVTWETSYMRAYLNGDFYNSFSEADRAKIHETTLANNDNPWDFSSIEQIEALNKTPGGNDTEDNIFLLSLDEVVKYFGDSEYLENQNHPNNHLFYGIGLGFSGQNSNGRIALNAQGQVSWWWLRSPGDVSSDAACVSTDGQVYVSGIYCYYGGGGVRPALWLNLAS
ncbi:MAG: DUF6273 domain-containing protein [Defluviitaleaceae bacterium]|nr:DUF6273 domain-containing protein [Defluviitaleaceae bacterium]